MPSKLARSLVLSIRGQPVNVKTPLLVPSFSSKALLHIGPVFEALQPSITESFLLSAYDIHYKHLQLPGQPFAEVMFLDSGGYEASKDFDLLDPFYASSKPSGWAIENYRQTLNSVQPLMPTYVTAFDHPDVRRPISEQIDAALDIFREFPDFGREILFKPETCNEDLLSIDSLLRHVSRFTEFDILGFTEIELGDSILERMVNIARIRAAVHSIDPGKPLHIFGSLDPVCTPLYFLAGADIFDGLSWLRFSYSNDLAVYHRNHIPLLFGIAEQDELSLARTYDANLHYLSKMKGRFTRYLLDGNENRLGPHGSFFAESIDDLRVAYNGVVV